MWRILQGIGGSFLFANAAAIVTDAFPRDQLGLAMGTNTMVAAVGLVIGPVLGGALVLISWHWVFWFNVPFALAGSAWAWLVLRELSGRSEDRSFDFAGTLTFLIGLTGLVLGISKGGISGWTEPPVIASLIAAAVFLPAVRADRAPQPGADARPVDLPEPLVLDSRSRRLHQRARAVRADVRIRLLLPGSAGRLADRRRHQARAARDRDADLLAAGGHLGRPHGLADAGRQRDGRSGRRPGADDHAAARQRLPRTPASTCSSSGSARACSTRPTLRR